MNEIDEQEGRFGPDGRWVKGVDLYEPRMAAVAAKIASLGGTVSDIITALGISRSTFYRYRSVYPEFADALQIGNGRQMDSLERSLYEQGMGYDYEEEVAIKVKVGKDVEEVKVVTITKHAPANPFAAVKLLGAKRRGEWLDKQPLVGVNVLNITADQAREELAEFFIEHPEYLPQLPSPEEKEGTAEATPSE